MGAFHNDAGIKETYLARVRQHRAADELIHGTYWENGRGCAVGCTVHSGNHAAYEDELGIPRRLAYLEDHIFENLPHAKSVEWPEAFLSGITVGAELSHIVDQFMAWLLVDKEAGVIRFADEQGKPAIEQVAALYQRRIAGEAVTEEEWLDARRATYDAQAASDADTAVAAYATAAYAAIAVDAPGAVADAAYDAADADASVDTAYTTDADVARCAHFVRMSEKLLELLASAPVLVEM